eukprot:scaffold182914_cov21-Tisochrysis_lutea.AAC.1
MSNRFILSKSSSNQVPMPQNVAMSIAHSPHSAFGARNQKQIVPELDKSPSEKGALECSTPFEGQETLCLGALRFPFTRNFKSAKPDCSMFHDKSA